MFSCMDENEYLDEYDCNTESIDYLPSDKHVEDAMRLDRILAEVHQNTRMNWNTDDNPPQAAQLQQGK